MKADRQTEIGLRLIVLYKLTKAVLEVAFGATVAIFADGVSAELQRLAVAVRDHATAAWSIALAERLVRAATARHLEIVALASLFDGVFSAVEGWALHKRYRWSGWLVIGATSCLLPFEAIALVRRLTFGRVTLLFVNALIVVYLVRHQGSMSRARAASRE